MNAIPINIVPITKARGELGNLTKKVTDNNYILLTKGGSPVAALVDPNYLEKLQAEVRKIYQKTYLDPKLLPFTRDFSDEEINQWQKEDQL